MNNISENLKTSIEIYREEYDEIASKRNLVLQYWCEWRLHRNDQEKRNEYSDQWKNTLITIDNRNQNNMFEYFLKPRI